MKVKFWVILNNCKFGRFPVPLRQKKQMRQKDETLRKICQKYRVRRAQISFESYQNQKP